MNTKSKCFVICATAVLPWVACVSAQTTSPPASSQQDRIFDPKNISVQAGLRLWANEWDVPIFQSVPLSNGTAVVQVTNKRSDFKFAPIPVIGITSGRIVANMTYMVPTDYNADTPGLSSIRREEFDASVGYSIFPPAESILLATVSYKYARIASEIPFFPEGSTHIDGVLFGLSASAPIHNNLRLVGSLAIGPAWQKFHAPTGDANNDALYRIAEVGLSYPLLSNAAGPVRSLTLTISYRAQFYTTKSASLPTTSSGQVIATHSQDISTTTQGPVIGLIASF